MTVAVTIFKDRKQSLFNKNAFSSDQDITNHINLIPLLDIPGSEAVLESGDLERAESGAVFRLISQSRTFLIRPIIRPSRPQARPAAPRTHKIHFTINLSGQLSSSSSPHVAARLLTVLSKMSVSFRVSSRFSGLKRHSQTRTLLEPNLFLHHIHCAPFLTHCFYYFCTFLVSKS